MGACVFIDIIKNMRALTSIEHITVSEINKLFNLADELKALPEKERMQLLYGKLLGIVFSQPSTRTRLSFETAMLRLG